MAANVAIGLDRSDDGRGARRSRRDLVLLAFVATATPSNCRSSSRAVRQGGARLRHVMRRDFRRAAQQFGKAVELDPGSSTFRENLRRAGADAATGGASEVVQPRAGQNE